PDRLDLASALQRGHLAGVRVKEFKLARLVQRQVNIGLEYLFYGCPGLKDLADSGHDHPHETSHQVPPVFEAAVNRGRIRACRPGDRTQSERLVASAVPQLMRGLQDAFFQIRIRLSRHCSFLPGMAPHYYVDDVYITPYI